MSSSSASTTVRDVVDAHRIEALAGLVGHPRGSWSVGMRVPLMWHLGLFLPAPRQSELGPDGHPLVGMPAPPEPGLRRMFAGGRVWLERGLRIGDEASMTTGVIREAEREGRTGRMHFVTTRSTVSVGSEVALVDERDIVYLRSGPKPDGVSRPVVPAPTGDSVWRVGIDPILLFRFSALTYNAHRIHYDRDYARDVEGYAGLVVHGPLQALLMAEAGAAALDGDVEPRFFDYTLVAPLLDHEGMQVVASRSADGRVELEVVDDAGRRTAKASLTAM